MGIIIIIIYTTFIILYTVLHVYFFSNEDLNSSSLS